jgi:hypothetical protein
MKEINIYYDEGKTIVVNEPIKFEPVMAGETTTHKLYIENVIEYPINIKFNLVDEDDVTLTEVFSKLESKETKSIEFTFTPSLVRMKPIQSKLNLSLKYVIV